MDLILDAGLFGTLAVVGAAALFGFSFWWALIPASLIVIACAMWWTL